MTVQEVEGPEERIRIFRYGRTVDSFAVITRRATILVDTLVSAAAMAQVLRALERDSRLDRPLIVINTHGDWDHVWGNGLFAGRHATYPAPIVGHAAAPIRMNTEQARQHLARSQQAQPEEYGTASLHPPTVTFDGRLTIDGGDLSIELLHTPGHTPDHLAVWIPQLAILIAGDAAELPFPFISPESDIAALRATLQRLTRLEPRLALYCHAPGITDPALIHQNIAYFDELERRCRACLAGDAVRAVMALTAEPALLGWPLPQALPSLATEFEPDGFHQRGHEAAIRAMLHWLRSPWSQGE